jgi:hypothetical protein
MSQLRKEILEQCMGVHEIYCSPYEVSLRRKFRAKHNNIEYGGAFCSDSRVRFEEQAEIPKGIINPFRDPGPKLVLGMPYFQRLVFDWFGYAVSKGRDCCFFSTYHFSSGAKERGCHGHHYDLEASQKSATELARELEQAYGKGPNAVFNVFFVGLETDSDAMVFHGDHGRIIDVRTLADSELDEKAALDLLYALYPERNRQVVAGLVPFLVGNVRHVRKIRESKRPLVANVHKETVLFFGRGAKVLGPDTRALIVSPFAANLQEPIGKMAGVLLDNLVAGRIDKEKGVLLMTSGLYRDPGPEKANAVVKSQWLAKVATEAIKEQAPKLLDYNFDTLVGITDANQMLYTPVDGR